MLTRLPLYYTPRALVHWLTHFITGMPHPLRSERLFLILLLIGQRKGGFERSISSSAHCLLLPSSGASVQPLESAGAKAGALFIMSQPLLEIQLLTLSWKLSFSFPKYQSKFNVIPLPLGSTLYTFFPLHLHQRGPSKQLI